MTGRDHNVHYKWFVPTGGIDVLADNRGGFLTLCYALVGGNNRKPKTDPVQYIINRYDENGHFVEELRTYADTFVNTGWNFITVDRDGVIYYMQFDRKCVYIYAYAKKGR